MEIKAKFIGTETFSGNYKGHDYITNKYYFVTSSSRRIGGENIPKFGLRPISCKSKELYEFKLNQEYLLDIGRYEKLIQFKEI